MLPSSDLDKKMRFIDDSSRDFTNHTRRQDKFSSPRSPRESVYLFPPEHEKRARREVANSNERRRMQSINSGFETLKTLLPTQDGEKLSKAAILQLTSKYIEHLMNENKRMRDQLAQAHKQDQQQQHQQHCRHAINCGSRKRKINVETGSAQNETGCTNLLAGCLQALNPIPDSHHCVATLSLAGKPDYELFVVEPASNQDKAAHAEQQQEEVQQQQPSSAQCLRLEHLVMAIEKIEGSSSYQSHNEKHMISPFTSLSVSNDDCSHRKEEVREKQQFIDDDDNDDDHDDEEEEKKEVNERLHKQQQQQELELPGSKNAQRRTSGIPHKYLHRPQVVQASIFK